MGTSGNALSYAYLPMPMSFATGPWHSPPNLPDDPAEWCLVLLHGPGTHYRYEVLRYAEGWVQQNDEALTAEAPVVRWAYITSSVERMSELPEPHFLPVESRLFVGDALSPTERALLLAAYVTELKADVARLKGALEHTAEGRQDDRAKGRLQAKVNELTAQLASRDQRLEAQRIKLIALHEEVQKLTSALAKRLTAEELKERTAMQEKRLADQGAQLARLGKALERALENAREQQERSNGQLVVRDRKIHQQRKTLIEMEALVVRLKQRLQQGGGAGA